MLALTSGGTSGDCDEARNIDILTTFSTEIVMFQNLCSACFPAYRPHSSLARSVRYMSQRVAWRVPFRVTQRKSTSPSHKQKIRPRGYVAANRTMAKTAVESAVPEKAADAATNAQPAMPSVIFFDCDDCLYKNDWRVAQMLTAKIESFCSDRLYMRPGLAYELYKKWGTCLRGMQCENLIDELGVEEYLEYAHDIPLGEHITPDPELRAMLLSLDPTIPKWVFTASTKPHATRCLELLGVSDLFQGVIDVRAVQWATKHDDDAYLNAMKIHTASLPGTTLKPHECLFLDDSTSNMKAAKRCGWNTVLVGRRARDTGELLECDDADHAVDTIHQLPEIMPHLFPHKRIVAAPESAVLPGR